MPQDPGLLKPCLWHSDLHTENIFVNPDDPTEITAIIDWQSVEVAPLLSQAGRPPFLAHKGPQATGFDEPRLPSDFENLTKLEQDQAQDLWLEQSLVVLYNNLISQRSPSLWQCMEYQQTLNYQIIAVAHILLFEGEATCMKMILDFIESHQDVLAKGTSEPHSQNRLRSLVRDRDVIQKGAEGAERAVEVSAEVQRVMGGLFPVHGQVPHDKYEEAKRALRQTKEHVISQFARTEQDRIAWRKAWPFDD